jgi:hypothetical protein
MRVFQFLLLFLVTVSSCKERNEYAIDLDTVKFMEIRKYEEFSYKQIPVSEHSKFIEHWNNAKGTGLAKFSPRYHVRVTLQNDSLLNFRISGRSIKLKSDYTYQIEDEAFFDRLYRQAL